MTRPGSFLWLARHELRLAWRDVAHMATAGRAGGVRKVAAVALIFFVCLHVVAFLVLHHLGDFRTDLPTLVAVTTTILLSGSAMLSQAMESVTRTFYTRSDLELILSSPLRASRLFAVRIGAIALSGSLMSLFLFGPFVDVLVWRSGWHWFGAYGVIIATSAVATALGVVLTISLFQLLGPKLTRLVAQIAAAVIGGAFVIGLQLAAMFSTGTVSRLAFLKSHYVMTHVPRMGSMVWWPARAALGDTAMVAVVITAALALLLATIALYAPRFADYALAARSAGEARRGASRHDRALSVLTASPSLRRKERILLLRDPWLISQSLMQLLYLLPPAFLLWHTFSLQGQSAVLLVPVLTMAAGQLAGGLAWLTISGEDAPDLVFSAPVPPARIWRAKAEAVLQCLAIIFSPFVLGLLFVSLRLAVIAALGIAVSGASAAAIQFWFRAQAKRSQFRRRHTSSRIATFSEAFSSIMWAATGAIAAAGSALAGIVAVMAIGILAGARYLSPARSREKSKQLAIGVEAAG